MARHAARKVSCVRSCASPASGTSWWQTVYTSDWYFCTIALNSKVVNGLPTSFQFRPGPMKCSPCAALLHIHTKQPFKILQKLLFL